MFQFLASPEVSKYPTFKDSDPKNHILNGFWDQSPSIANTWTLWVLLKGSVWSAGSEKFARLGPRAISPTRQQPPQPLRVEQAPLEKQVAAFVNWGVLPGVSGSFQGGWG